MQISLRSAFAIALLALTLFACESTVAPTDAGTDALVLDAGPPDTGLPPPFELTSSAFAQGATVPLRYECGPPAVADGPGQNVSPPLSWTAGPPATMSYALVVRDIDAGGLVHWVVYDLPASARSIPEGVSPGYEPAALAGGRQAELQGSGYFGYFGPCSPGRVNTYRFTLHALGSPSLAGVDRTTSEDDAAIAIEAASIASAVLDGES